MREYTYPKRETAKLRQRRTPIALNHDGTRLASYFAERLEVYELPSGRLLRAQTMSEDLGGVRLVFTGEGRLRVYGMERKLRNFEAWELVEGEREDRATSSPQLKLQRKALAFTLAPDHRQIALWGPLPTQLTLLETETFLQAETLTSSAPTDIGPFHNLGLTTLRFLEGGGLALAGSRPEEARVDFLSPEGVLSPGPRIPNALQVVLGGEPSPGKLLVGWRLNTAQLSTAQLNATELNTGKALDAAAVWETWLVDMSTGAMLAQWPETIPQEQRAWPGAKAQGWVYGKGGQPLVIHPRTLDAESILPVAWSEAFPEEGGK